MLTFFERSPLDQVLRNDKVHRIQPCFQSPVKISGQRPSVFCNAEPPLTPVSSVTFCVSFRNHAVQRVLPGQHRDHCLWPESPWREGQTLVHGLCGTYVSVCVGGGGESLECMVDVWNPGQNLELPQEVCLFFFLPWVCVWSRRKTFLSMLPTEQQKETLRHSKHLQDLISWGVKTLGWRSNLVNSPFSPVSLWLLQIRGGKRLSPHGVRRVLPGCGGVRHQPLLLPPGPVWDRHPGMTTCLMRREPYQDGAAR